MPIYEDKIDKLLRDEELERPSLAESVPRPITLIPDERDSALVDQMRISLRLAERVSELERYNRRLLQKMQQAGIEPEDEQGPGYPKTPEDTK